MREKFTTARSICQGRIRDFWTVFNGYDLEGERRIQSCLPAMAGGIPRACCLRLDHRLTKEPRISELLRQQGLARFKSPRQISCPGPNLGRSLPSLTF